MAHQAAYTVLSNRDIAAGATAISNAIPIGLSSGYFSVSGTLTGTDVAVTLEYLSGDGDRFVAGDMAIAQTLTSSPFHIQFYPKLAESLKIKVTNNSASPVTVSLTVRFTEAN